MLNQAVADQMLGIANEGADGVLWLNGDSVRLRFAFQGGTPVAIDLGRDKDAILADKLLEYHKIGPDMHRMLGDVIAANQGAIAAGQSPVLDFLAQQESLAAGEAEQTTQAMVEDSLVLALSGEVHDLHFVPGESVESFDFARSALRIRIDAQMLVASARARAEEDAAARSDVGGPDEVFALEEREDGSAPLTEHERAVLGAIDGRRSVEEVSAELRDAWFRVARVIRVLVAKKVVRRVAGAANASRAKAAIEALRQEAANAASQPILVPDPPRRGPSPVMAVIIAGGLVIAGGLWWLVDDYNTRRQAMENIAADVRAAISEGRYPQARTEVERGRAQAANDLAAKERMDELERDIETAIAADLASAVELAKNYDFTEARDRLLRVPDGPASQDGLRALAEAEEAFRLRSLQIERTVAEALAKDDLAGALAAAQAETSQLGAAGRESLDRWRIGRIEEALPPGVPPAKRTALIAQVRSVDPTPDQGARLASIETDITRQLTVLAGRIRDLQAEADAGDWKSALDGATALTDQVAGSSLAGDLASLRDRCDAVQGAVDRYIAQALSAIRTGAVADLDTAETSGAEVIAAQAKAPNLGSIRQVVDALGQVRSALGRAAMSEQASAIDVWLRAAGDTHPAAEAAMFRRDTLRQVETSITAALDAARRASVDGDLALAKSTLETLVAKPELRQSVQAADAAKALAQVRESLATRAALEGELDAAMASGDIAGARELAVRMNLRYLPLQITSVPAGAEIIQGEEVLGKTPLVLRVSAAERSETVYTLRLNGYEPASLDGSKAAGGWQLATELVRIPAVTGAVDLALTGRPSRIGDQAAIACRTAIAMIDAAGLVTMRSLETGDGALQQPVYGPVWVVDGAPMVGSRDGVALRIDGERIVRLAQGGNTDLPPAIYRSPYALDRILVIVAGDDGRLHALNGNKPSDQWQSAAGALFATSPTVVGDEVLAVRTDGSLLVLSADQGLPMRQSNLGRAVAGAWLTGRGVAGMAGAMVFTWEGGEPAFEEAPAEAAVAGPDAFITSTGRPWLRTAGGWKELPKIDGKITGIPVAWQDQVAVAVDSRVVVSGPRPFSVDLGADALDPLPLPGGRLLVVAANGRFALYEP
jgi:hypothetical protein